MNALRRALLAAAVASVAGGAGRAQEIEIIALRYRRAEELLPLLRPFVAPGGALTGQGHQLFLRTSPANAREIRQLLETLDRAPRELLITVRQDRADTRVEQHAGARGSVTVGSAGISGGLQVEAGNARTVNSGGSEQRIRVLEGGRAYLALGTAVPLAFRRFVVTPQGLTEVGGTVYYEAVTGFHAQAQVSGEMVTIELVPVQSEVTAGGVERAQLSTTVRGRLGEWIADGDVDLRSDREERSVLAAQSRAQSGRHAVWLKVEEVGAPR